MQILHGYFGPVTLDAEALRLLLEAAATTAVAFERRRVEPSADLISQNEAWRRYGRRVVANWVKGGRVKQHRRAGKSANSKILYSAAELLTASKSLELDKVISRKM